MKRILTVVLAATLTGGVAEARPDAPIAPTRATPADCKEILQMLREVDRSLDRLDELVDDGGRWKPECRGYSPEKTVRCAAATFDPPGGAAKAVAVWSCESNFGIEPEHSDAYHGPFQFLYSTYAGQQAAMPDVVEWYELSPAVHDVRSNVMTAVAYAARGGWGAWSCA